MPIKTTTYNILISCPSDINEEIDIVKKTISKFNNEFSTHLGINLLPRFYKTDAYPQSGASGQEIINAQLVDTCDATISIFWTKFGSPTENYGSGTEEEVERCLKDGKQVFMYFSNKPISPNKMNSEEYEKIQQFKNKYANKGLYFEFETLEKFAQMLYSHLTKHFIRLDTENSFQSDLKIMGIIKGKENEKFIVENFTLNHYKNLNDYYNDILNLIENISNINLDLPSSQINNTKRPPFYTYIQINFNVIFTIKEFAKANKLIIGQDFFNLGNSKTLKDNNNLTFEKRINTEIFWGTHDEYNKYTKINKLYDMIIDIKYLNILEDNYRNYKNIILALKNNSSSYDESIFINMKIKSTEFIHHYNLQLPNKYIAEYILDNEDLHKIFGYVDNSYIHRYKNDTNITAQSKTSNLNDPLQIYKNKLNDIFDYEYFIEGEYTTIRFKIDKINPNSAIAFPTPIFVNKEIDYIEYEINSKFSENIIKGKIENINK